MSPDAGAPFDLSDPLPRGKLAIQASAGTGKTYALAALATRLIAEGRASAGELLIVTFTRAATDELRTKVRERLVTAVGHLSDPAPAPGDDELMNLLDTQRSSEQLDRLERAVSEFDAATVTTLHGFAAQVLGALGVSAGGDPDARLDADSSGVTTEVCADVLVRAAVSGHPVDLLPSLDTLTTAVGLADGRPDLVLEPVPGRPGATPGQVLLRRLVDEGVRMVAARRRERGTLSFDDVLIQLRDALVGPGGEGAISALRSRFRAALIDEFQDTDPVQWEIFSTLFDSPDAGCSLVLVGDPKQAIYGFRGADVHTYLRAVADGRATERRSLSTNWRSDDRMVRALGALLEDVTFGGADIPFSPVEAAATNRGRYLLGADGEPVPALSVRLAIGQGITRSKRQSHLVTTGPGEQAVYADLVGGVRRLLDEGRLPDGPGETGQRPVHPSDIAVLVGRHSEATDIQAVLADSGVPAVVARGGSVLESAAAEQMRWLLHALARPADPRRVRMYALSWFSGLSVAEVASLSEVGLAALQEQLRQWSELLGTHSVADTFARVWSESGVVPRVLGDTDGDRNMTDLDHLVELFEGTGPGGRSDVLALVAVLDTPPRKEADTEVDGDVSARRIASEADSVQIMTVWAAKGLEFPVVCLPTLWRAPRKDGPVVSFDPVTGRRTFDLAGGEDWPDEEEAAARRRRAAAEAAGERFRLLYVALTRAQHHTMVWWVPVERSDQSALAHVLFARHEGRIDRAAFEVVAVAVPPDSEVIAALEPLQVASGHTLDVRIIGGPPPATGPWISPAADRGSPDLQLATLDTTPDRRRQRWSFSAIVAGSTTARHDPDDASLSDGGAGDEGEVGADGPPDDLLIGRPRHDPDVTGAPAGGSVAFPLADLPAGAAFGTMVHSVLEAVDFRSSRLDEELAGAVDDQLRWRTVPLTPTWPAGATAEEGRGRLIDGLRAAIATPLGPLCGGARLADIGVGDRLTEVSFDLRLADAGSMPRLADIGGLVQDHLGPADPMAGWAARLARGALDVTLAGHLTGSIDLVLRVPGGSGGPTFVVADYKTNALHRRGLPARPADYGRTRMAAAMAEHDYPLQALLYSVALHRYLRWRQPGYRPEIHLGGIAYLFLRGMVGPGSGSSSEAPAGVFDWALPSGLVEALSDLLDGRTVGVPA